MSNEYTTDNGEGILRTGYTKRRYYRSVTERAAVSGSGACNNQVTLDVQGGLSMAIIVKGRNTVVSPAVKAYVEKKIDKVTRQFKAVGDITAVLKVENGNHIAEITVPARGILLRAQESTKDMYSSIDLVVEKIERQVHKYKTKLMKRKYNNFREVPADAAPAAEPVTVQAKGEEDFKIIRSKSFTMNPMTPEEAILQMNLLNHDFFVFYDPDFGGVSVVYRRKDGNYGLLEPKLE